VLIGQGQKAELSTEMYLPETPVLENFVILRKNPDFKEEDNVV
jgi:26S proteasome regulatory subunit N1